MRSTVAGVLAAFVGGLGGAAQSRVNAALAGRLHDGVAAALVSNLTALVLVTAAVAVAPSARAGLVLLGSGLRRGGLRAWECVGGACGAVYVASQGVSAGVLGLAVFTVAVVAGQTGGGLAVDRAGIAPGGSRPVTPARLAGAAVTVAAVVIAAGGRLRAGTSLALAVLPLLAGMALAVQGAVNGRVQRAAGAVLPAVFLNAAVGTGALLLVFGVTGVLRGWPSGSLPTQPWLYAGGAIGACFTAIGVAVVRRIGVLLLGLAVIAGQLTGATALDLIAPGPAGPPGLAGFLGVGLTLTAVAVSLSPKLPFRRG
jgi:transporter family-2 protein